MGCVFGEVVEGEEVLSKINNTITDGSGRPYQDIRITHTVVLHDPYDDPSGLEFREDSPEPTEEMLASSRIGADENINDYAGKSEEEINEIIADKEAKARAAILEMVGDIPDAEIAPPENVLFVCKLNPVTCDDDLEIIFSRFGPVVSCEVIRDRVSGESLQYAFVEFADRAACEQAYFKMDNVLIDDRRIHVDFSQSVSKYRWKGKGRLEILDDKKPEKKKVDLKEMIDKERAEIKSKGDGKIERNEKNLQGRSREQEGNRDDGYKRGTGREDRRKDDRRERNYHHEDERRSDKERRRDRSRDRGRYDDDRRRERNDNKRSSYSDRKERSRLEERNYGNSRDRDNGRKDDGYRRDRERDERRHKEKGRDDRRDDRNDRYQHGRERKGRDEESDSSQERRKKSRKESKRRKDSSSSDSSD